MVICIPRRLKSTRSRAKSSTQDPTCCDHVLFNPLFPQTMPPRLLPYVNFAIASVALAFQVGVLLPWHHELDKKFDESVISPPPSTVLPPRRRLFCPVLTVIQAFSSAVDAARRAPRGSRVINEAFAIDN